MIFVNDKYDFEAATVTSAPKFVVLVPYAPAALPVVASPTTYGVVNDPGWPFDILGEYTETKGNVPPFAVNAALNPPL